MSIFKNNDISIGLTSLFMKILGLWVVKDRSERRTRNLAFAWAAICFLCTGYITFYDLLKSWGDFAACLYAACNVLSVAMPLFKIIVLITHKPDFFRLFFHMERKFLRGDYNDYERNLVVGCKRQCSYFICVFTLFTQATVAAYFASPLISNIGKNESDRTLPVKIWIDLPLSLTPYYEITFLIEVFSVYYVGVGYFCVDNFLCIMNLHLATQFRILQYRMSSMPELKNNEKEEEELLNRDPSYLASKCYSTFKKHVKQHQELIAYAGKMEKVYSLIALGQVLMFSMLICLDGYQILMPEVEISRRMIFVFHIIGCIAQLLMFTYSCDCIMRESSLVATSIYAGPWTKLPAIDDGMFMRRDLVLVIMRSETPCCLTAGGFFVVSLETYTSVLSTAASYFTLLRQNSEEADVS